MYRGGINNSLSNDMLREVLTILHSNISESFKTLNGVLPTRNETGYFWAESSRSLIRVIEITNALINSLEGTELAIKLEPYYSDIFDKCLGFLQHYNGSHIPIGMERITIYFVKPIFFEVKSFEAENSFSNSKHFEWKIIGEGSYELFINIRIPFIIGISLLKKRKKI